MRVVTSAILTLLCSLVISQTSYENDYLLYDEVEDDFGEYHRLYLQEDIEITRFDRAEYEKLVKLMVLKSRGVVSLDMDNIDPDFDPDRYFRTDPRGGGGSDSLSGSGYGGYGGGSNDGGYYDENWDRDYDRGGGEYADDWYEYERRHGQYEENQEKDRRDVKRREREYQRAQQRQSSRSQQESSGGAGLLLILLLVIVLVLVIAFLFFRKEPDTKVKQQNLEDLAPTEIPKSELELMLEKALANEDYRKAIRIYFIFIMKDLSQKGWIVWQKKKTNLLYLREMKGRPHFEEFKKVVSIYEVVWYGEREITKADYEAVEPMLKQTLFDFENYK